MNKIKVMIVGDQDAVVDDFFTYTGENFFTISSSPRATDIYNHLKIFTPDVFVFCTGKDPVAESEYICSAKKLTKEADPLMVLITDKNEYEDLNPIAINYIDHLLMRPLSIKDIVEGIKTRYLEKIEAKERVEEERRKLEQKQVIDEKKHVLIVDDDPVMLRTVKLYLGDEFSVATAPSGKFALKFLEQKHTDLVLLDYEMPEMNGQEVFSHIKANPNMAGIPVVFLTGISDTAKIKEVLAMRPSGYLLKPVDNERLHQVLESLL